MPSKPDVPTQSTLFAGEEHPELAPKPTRGRPRKHPLVERPAPKPAPLQPAQFTRAYQAQAVLLGCLPHKRPVDGIFVREVVHIDPGRGFKLITRAHVAPTKEGVGVPFGRDRLLLIWLLTRAKIEDRRRIVFTRSEVLRDLEGLIDPTDKQGFRAMVERVIHVAFTLERVIQEPNYGNKVRKRWRRRGSQDQKVVMFRSVKEVDWIANERKGEETTYQVEFTTDFFKEDLPKAVPMGMDMLRTLAGRSKELDLVWFLSWKAAEAQRIAEEEIGAQAAAGSEPTLAQKAMIRERTAIRISWDEDAVGADPFQSASSRFIALPKPTDGKERRGRETLNRILELMRSSWPGLDISWEGGTLLIHPPLGGSPDWAAQSSEITLELAETDEGAA